MRRLFTLGVILLLQLCCAMPIFAQGIKVSGIVFDENKAGLPGVGVMIEGSSQGTATDLNGKFELTVPSESSKLIFTFIGYKAQSIIIGNQTNFSIQMSPDIEELEEIVVIGYGSLEKKDVTGSISSISSKDFNTGSVSSPDQLFQGRAAGVMMTPATGEPGGGVNIRVRGGTSLTASNEPLYVIDGFPIDNTSVDPGTTLENSASTARNPLSTINPNDIESIEILKDASSTAIYGSRAANGVIIITTKSGKGGKTSVSYDGAVGLSTIAKKLDVLTAQEYREFNPNADDQAASTDWQDVMTRQALTHNHNISMTGGSEKTQYRLSGNYFKQDGILINSGVERFNGSFNLNQKVNERLNIKANVLASYVIDNYLPYGTGSAGNSGVINSMLRVSPLMDQNFEPTLPELKNPYTMAETTDDFTYTKRILANLSADYDITQHLTAQVRIGTDLNGAKRKSFFPAYNWWFSNGRGGQQQKDLMNNLLETTLTYKNQWKDHRLNAVGGYTFQEYTLDEFGLIANTFQFDQTGVDNIGSSTVETSYSNKEKNRLVSFFGRANYTFKDRYVLNATLRADGSSKFGPNNKWGIFPAVSAAWRLSEESFLQGNSVLTDLKLRAGWGVTGSQEIANLQAIGIIGSDLGHGAILDNPNSVSPGVAPKNNPNPDLKWEETSQINIGADFDFLSGRIYGNLDFYIKDTYDLLLQYDASQPANGDNRFYNIGEVRNSGIELALNTVNIQRDDFTWTTGLNLSFNQNEVQSLGYGIELIETGDLAGRGLTGAYAQIITPGEPYGTIYGKKYLGIDENGNELLSEESQIIGTAMPKVLLGLNNAFNYKNVDFSFFFQGSMGNDVVNNTAMELSDKASAQANGSQVNALRNVYDDNQPNGVTAFSDRFVEDGSFLRLANLTLGYTFNTVNMKNISHLRVYLTGQNLFVLTNYSGFDPEVNTPTSGGRQVPAYGIDYNNYPRSRTFTFGVNVTF
ncbi:TonB-dependent receptor [Persicobacter diffluens]|uniref:SusC/RagA family TonB-linked outer membrane protein n=1 Tax=Persicobacter diffluens TaxID=981 RepID=A0AAN4W087_9BACT|nr:SusC/RagA family TonB-linked outer membrane protein [Persicobacter diffluens]